MGAHHYVHKLNHYLEIIHALNALCMAVIDVFAAEMVNAFPIVLQMTRF
jgi:hypothetical protein